MTESYNVKDLCKDSFCIIFRVFPSPKRQCDIVRPKVNKWQMNLFLLIADLASILSRSSPPPHNLKVPRKQLFIHRKYESEDI